MISTQLDSPTEYDISVVKKEIASAWANCLQAEKHGIEFGRVCYDWQSKLKKQGNRHGEKGLLLIWEEVGIPRSTAYRWIDVYTKSAGIKKPTKETVEKSKPEVTLESLLEKLVHRVVMQPYGYYAAKFATYPEQHTTELKIVAREKLELWKQIAEISKTKLEQHATVPPVTAALAEHKTAASKSSHLQKRFKDICKTIYWATRWPGHPEGSLGFDCSKLPSREFCLEQLERIGNSAATYSAKRDKETIDATVRRILVEFLEDNDGVFQTAGEADNEAENRFHDFVAAYPKRQVKYENDSTRNDSALRNIAAPVAVPPILTLKTLAAKGGL